jgi:hypothetical protein
MRLAGLAPLITWPGGECLTTVLPLLAIFKMFISMVIFFSCQAKTDNLIISGRMFDHCATATDHFLTYIFSDIFFSFQAAMDSNPQSFDW